MEFSQMAKICPWREYRTTLRSQEIHVCTPNMNLHGKEQCCEPNCAIFTMIKNFKKDDSNE